MWNCPCQAVQLGAEVAPVQGRVQGAVAAIVQQHGDGVAGKLHQRQLPGAGRIDIEPEQALAGAEIRALSHASFHAWCHD